MYKSNLINPDGSPLKQEGRRELKTGLIKQSPYGDVKFLLKIDMPDTVPQDNFNQYLLEFGNVLVEALKRKI
jgi:hypothetical protein